MSVVLKLSRILTIWTKGSHFLSGTRALIAIPSVPVIPSRVCLMPPCRPHEQGLQLAGDPPTFEAYAGRPESEWHLAQDAWLAQFSVGKRTLPPPGRPGSAESKLRSKEWNNVLKQHGKAKRASLAAADDESANAALDIEADNALQRSQEKKRSFAGADAKWHPRPPGPAPDLHPIWDHTSGCWKDKSGEQRPDATRNERRVQQRNDSEDQTERHKQKWELYESCGRHYYRHHPEEAEAAAAFNRRIKEDERK